jgi:hypothetical protein
MMAEVFQKVGNGEQGGRGYGDASLLADPRTTPVPCHLASED